MTEFVHLHPSAKSFPLEIQMLRTKYSWKNSLKVLNETFPNCPARFCWKLQIKFHFENRTWDNVWPTKKFRCYQPVKNLKHNCYPNFKWNIRTKELGHCTTVLRDSGKSCTLKVPFDNRTWNNVTECRTFVSNITHCYLGNSMLISFIGHHF